MAQKNPGTGWRDVYAQQNGTSLSTPASPSSTQKGSNPGTGWRQVYSEQHGGTPQGLEIWSPESESSGEAKIWSPESSPTKYEPLSTPKAPAGYKAKFESGFDFHSANTTQLSAYRDRLLKYIKTENRWGSGLFKSKQEGGRDRLRREHALSDLDVVDSMLGNEQTDYTVGDAIESAVQSFGYSTRKNWSRVAEFLDRPSADQWKAHADELQRKAEAESQRSSDKIGILSPVITEGLNLAGDTALNMLTFGGAGMANMLTRSFIGGVEEGRAKGYSGALQAVSGAKSAMFAWATEKMAGLGNTLAYGKGAGDDLIEAAINGLTKSPKGQNVLRFIAAGLSEGGEEAVEDLLNYGFDRLTGLDPNAELSGSEVLQDALVGAILGWAGQPLQIASGAYNPANARNWVKNNGGNMKAYDAAVEAKDTDTLMSIMAECAENEATKARTERAKSSSLSDMSYDDLLGLDVEQPTSTQQFESSDGAPSIIQRHWDQANAIQAAIREIDAANAEGTTDPRLTELREAFTAKHDALVELAEAESLVSEVVFGNASTETYKELAENELARGIYEKVTGNVIPTEYVENNQPGRIADVIEAQMAQRTEPEPVIAAETAPRVASQEAADSAVLTSETPEMTNDTAAVGTLATGESGEFNNPLRSEAAGGTIETAPTIAPETQKGAETDGKAVGRSEVEGRQRSRDSSGPEQTVRQETEGVRRDDDSGRVRGSREEAGQSGLSADIFRRRDKAVSAAEAHKTGSSRAATVAIWGRQRKAYEGWYRVAAAMLREQGISDEQIDEAVYAQAIFDAIDEALVGREARAELVEALRPVFGEQAGAVLDEMMEGEKPDFPVVGEGGDPGNETTKESLAKLKGEPAPRPESKVEEKPKAEEPAKAKEKPKAEPEKRGGVLSEDGKTVTFEHERYVHQGDDVKVFGDNREYVVRRGWKEEYLVIRKEKGKRYILGRYDSFGAAKAKLRGKSSGYLMAKFTLSNGNEVEFDKDTGRLRLVDEGAFYDQSKAEMQMSSAASEMLGIATDRWGNASMTTQMFKLDFGKLGDLSLFKGDGLRYTRGKSSEEVYRRKNIEKIIENGIWSSDGKTHYVFAGQTSSMRKNNHAIMMEENAYKAMRKRMLGGLTEAQINEMNPAKYLTNQGLMFSPSNADTGVKLRDAVVLSEVEQLMHNVTRRFLVTDPVADAETIAKRLESGYFREELEKATKEGFGEGARKHAKEMARKRAVEDAKKMLSGKKAGSILTICCDMTIGSTDGAGFIFDPGNPDLGSFQTRGPGGFKGHLEAFDFVSYFKNNLPKGDFDFLVRNDEGEVVSGSVRRKDGGHIEIMDKWGDWQDIETKKCVLFESTVKFAGAYKNSSRFYEAVGDEDVRRIPKEFVYGHSTAFEGDESDSKGYHKASLAQLLRGQPALTKEQVEEVIKENLGNPIDEIASDPRKAAKFLGVDLDSKEPPTGGDVNASLAWFMGEDFFKTRYGQYVLHQKFRQVAEDLRGGKLRFEDDKHTYQWVRTDPFGIIYRMNAVAFQNAERSGLTAGEIFNARMGEGTTLIGRTPSTEWTDLQVRQNVLQKQGEDGTLIDVRALFEKYHVSDDITYVALTDLLPLNLDNDYDGDTVIATQGAIAKSVSYLRSKMEALGENPGMFTEITHGDAKKAIIKDASVIVQAVQAGLDAESIGKFDTGIEYIDAMPTNVVYKFLQKHKDRSPWGDKLPKNKAEIVRQYKALLSAEFAAAYKLNVDYAKHQSYPTEFRDEVDRYLGDIDTMLNDAGYFMGDTNAYYKFKPVPDYWQFANKGSKRAAYWRAVQAQKEKGQRAVIKTDSSTILSQLYNMSSYTSKLPKKAKFYLQSREGFLKMTKDMESIDLTGLSTVDPVAFSPLAIGKEGSAFLVNDVLEYWDAVMSYGGTEADRGSNEYRAKLIYDLYKTLHGATGMNNEQFTSMMLVTLSFGKSRVGWATILNFDPSNFDSDSTEVSSRDIIERNIRILGTASRVSEEAHHLDELLTKANERIDDYHQKMSAMLTDAKAGHFDTLQQQIKNVAALRKQVADLRAKIKSFERGTETVQVSQRDARNIEEFIANAEAYTQYGEQLRAQLEAARKALFAEDIASKEERKRVQSFMDQLNDLTVQINARLESMAADARLIGEAYDKAVDEYKAINESKEGYEIGKYPDSGLQGADFAELSKKVGALKQTVEDLKAKATAKKDTKPIEAKEPEAKPAAQPQAPQVNNAARAKLRRLMSKGKAMTAEDAKVILNDAELRQAWEVAHGKTLPVNQPALARNMIRAEAGVAYAKQQVKKLQDPFWKREAPKPTPKTATPEPAPAPQPVVEAKAQPEKEAAPSPTVESSPERISRRTTYRDNYTRMAAAVNGAIEAIGKGSQKAVPDSAKQFLDPEGSKTHNFGQLRHDLDVFSKKWASVHKAEDGGKSYREFAAGFRDMLRDSKSLTYVFGDETEAAAKAAERLRLSEDGDSFREAAADFAEIVRFELEMLPVRMSYNDAFQKAVASKKGKFVKFLAGDKATSRAASVYFGYQRDIVNLLEGLDNFDKHGDGPGYKMARMLLQNQYEAQQLKGTTLDAITRAKIAYVKSGAQSQTVEIDYIRDKEKDHLTLTMDQAIDLEHTFESLSASKLSPYSSVYYRLSETESLLLSSQAQYFAIRSAIKAAIDASPEATAYYKVFDSAYKTFAKPMKSAVEKANGRWVGIMDEGKYYPLSFRQSKGDTSAAHGYDFGLNDLGFTKNRTSVTGGVIDILDPSVRATSYIEQASKLVGRAEFGALLSRLNRGGYAPTVTEIVEQAYGKGQTDVIKQSIKDASNFREDEDASKSFLRQMRMNLQRGALLGNFGSMLKQYPSVFNAAGVLDMDCIVRGIAAYTNAENRERAGKVGAIKTRRQGNIDPDLVDTLKLDNWFNRLLNKLKIVDFAKSGFEIVDTAAIKTIYLASEIQAAKDGKAGDADYIEAKFREAFLQTQPQFDSMLRPYVQTSHDELVRMFGMFKTQPLRNLNTMIRSINEFNTAQAKYGKGSSEYNESLKTMRSTIAGQVVASSMFGALGVLAKLVYHRRRDLEDEEGRLDIEKVGARVLFNSIEASSGMLVFGDSAAQFLIDKLTKNTDVSTQDFYGISVGWLTTMKDTLDSFSDFVDKPTWYGAKKLAGNLATDFGIPLNNAYAIVNSLAMYSKDVGGTNPKHYNDMLQWLDKKQSMSPTQLAALTVDEAVLQLKRGNAAKAETLLGTISGANGNAVQKALVSHYADGHLTEEQLIQFLKAYTSVNADDLDRLLRAAQRDRAYSEAKKQNAKGVSAVEALLKSVETVDGGPPKPMLVAEAVVDSGLTDSQQRAVLGKYAGADYLKSFDALIGAGYSTREAVDVIGRINTDDEATLTQAELFEHYLDTPADQKAVETIWNALHPEDGITEQYAYTGIKNAYNNYQITAEEAIAWFVNNTDYTYEKAKETVEGWADPREYYQAKQANPEGFAKVEEQISDIDLYHTRTDTDANWDEARIIYGSDLSEAEKRIMLQSKASKTFNGVFWGLMDAGFSPDVAIDAYEAAFKGADALGTEKGANNGVLSQAELKAYYAKHPDEQTRAVLDVMWKAQPTWKKKSPFSK